MTKPLEVIGPRNAPAPYTYVLTELGTVELQSVFAHFDGTGASGAFRPTLTVRAQDGSIIARVFPDSTLAAGDEADVTFAPFLGAVAASTGGGGEQVLWAINLPGPRIVATGTAREYPPLNGTLTEVAINLGSAPSLSSFTAQARKNGSVIGSATIAAGGFTGTFVPSDVTVTIGDFYTVDVTAVGAGNHGSDLVVQFVGTWA